MHFGSFNGKRIIVFTIDECSKSDPIFFYILNKNFIKKGIIQNIADKILFIFNHIKTGYRYCYEYKLIF